MDGGLWNAVRDAYAAGDKKPSAAAQNTTAPDRRQRSDITLDINASTRLLRNSQI
jgi:hypothetical protein